MTVAFNVMCMHPLDQQSDRNKDDGRFARAGRRSTGEEVHTCARVNARRRDVSRMAPRRRRVPAEPKAGGGGGSKSVHEPVKL